MIKFYINDRYIKGNVAFERYGDKAKMSYMGTPKLPANAQYDIDGTRWRVISAVTSDFNSQIVNVQLEEIR